MLIFNIKKLNSVDTQLYVNYKTLNVQN